MIFLMLFRYVPRCSWWLAKHAGRLTYRNCNLQTLVLAPLVLVLLLLPAVFHRGDPKPDDASRRSTPVAYQPAEQTALPDWAADF